MIAPIPMGNWGDDWANGGANGNGKPAGSANGNGKASGKPVKPVKAIQIWMVPQPEPQPKVEEPTEPQPQETTQPQASEEVPANPPAELSSTPPAEPTPAKQPKKPPGYQHVKNDLVTRRRRMFLRCYAECGNVSKACKASGLNHGTISRWRKASVGFRRAFTRARHIAADKLEAEAWRRAHDGCHRKKFTAKGDPIVDPVTGQQYEEIDYSDRLLIFLLQAMRPKRFKRSFVEKNVKHEHSGSIEIVKTQQVRQEILQSPQYLDYLNLRQCPTDGIIDSRDCATDGNAGPVR